MGRDLSEFLEIMAAHEGHQAVGLQVEKLADGLCRLRWKPTTMTSTPWDHLYSGALAWALDAASNSAVFSAVEDDQTQVQLSVASQILRPAPFEQMTVVGNVARRTRTMAFADSWIEDSQGRHVCRGQSTHAIVPMQ